MMLKRLIIILGCWVGLAPSIKAQTITAMEYFIDIDPGFGLATAVSITAGASIDVNFNASTTSLPVGFHQLVVRVQDVNGIWSVIERKSFYVSQTNLNVAADVAAIEYFIDTDPGYGNGIPLTFTAGNTVSLSTIISTNTLPQGYHNLYVRAMDMFGVWGLVDSRLFYVDAFTADSLAGFEYFFNTDPGFGAAIVVPFSPPVDSLDTTVVVPTAALLPGTHTLGIRLQTKNGFYGLTDYYNITICDGATASLLSDVVCMGAATTFIDASTNVLTGDVYSWDFDNDGVADANTAGSQAFTYPAAGTYWAKLSIDRLGCLSVDSVQVIVEALPVANAGLDQSLCVGNTVLEGSFLGPNESGSWSVLSGSTLIANAADSVSSITNITTNTVDLIWTVTNTLGGCGDSDTVRITVNLPITATLLNQSVDIGQTINIDVQTPAVVNPGDTLTTSIVTMPLYGMANLLADGTIDYIPDQDANSTDSLRYRITNQCSNFDENQVLFTVINSPPVIDTVNITPTVGSTEITIDLTTIISDPNGNIDFSTITVVTQPISGAVASIDASGVLTIDYRGITFTGTDRLEVQVCDLVGVCTIETITIPNVEVGGVNPPITVFNGVSPNGDGFNDFLEIENIEFYPDNTVIILNRWGAEIERFQGYNNQDIIFDNANLPSGTYYYHILPGVQDVQEVTGHFLLKID
jgi:gliding motility-associated-like protein